MLAQLHRAAISCREWHPFSFYLLIITFLFLFVTIFLYLYFSNPLQLSIKPTASSTGNVIFTAENILPKRAVKLEGMHCFLKYSDMKFDGSTSSFTHLIPGSARSAINGRCFLSSSVPCCGGSGGGMLQSTGRRENAIAHTRSVLCWDGGSCSMWAMGHTALAHTHRFQGSRRYKGS